MAFLGHVIKNLIEFKHSVAPQQPEDPVTAQQNQLLWLLEQARDTSFGKFHNFAEIAASDTPYELFRRRVPIFDYHQLYDEWWHRQLKAPDITWPGKPEYFALSSGTTGRKSKRIPVTRAMLESVQSVGRAQAECLANFDLPAEFYERDVLMLSSSAALKQVDDHLEGEISGINVSNLPGFMASYYKPGIDIARIEDWDERVAAIVEAAPGWDVGAIAGIPSWVQLMLQQIIDRHGLRNIHEMWPNLSVYTTGGVAFEPYRESFESLLDHPIHIMDTYLASEGFFAFNARPGTLNMRLAVANRIFYEFIPFNNKGFDEAGNILDKPEVLTIDQVEEGVDYALLVSTPAGAWRYMIGDTVKFTDLKRCEIRISGRTKYFLNVVGSQLSEEKINAAIQELTARKQVRIKEFGVAAVKNEQGEYVHQWVLGLDGGELSGTEAAQQLDEFLQGMNKNYKVARSKALKGVRALAVPADLLYNWLEQGRSKGGQIKMPKVMPEERMNDLLSFLKSKSVAGPAV